MKKRLSLFVLWYLRFLARLQIKKIKPKIIGVGGASGKTSLSNFIYIILKSKFKVKQGKGKNSETGIPLDILKLNNSTYSYLDWLKLIILAPLRVFFDFEKYEIYIAEMGIDSPLEPKNMSYLLKIIKPDIGVLTNISYEHSVYFDPLVEEDKDREKSILNMTIAQESLLLTSLSSDKKAIVNLDDENIKEIKNIRANVLTVSKKDKNADFYIENIKNFVNEFLLQFKYKEKRYELKIDNPLPEHFGYSFILAIAVSKEAGVDIQDAISALEEGFYLPPGRMSVFKGIKDTIVIDSSYNNATLTPILDLLAFVKDIGKQRRRIGIIGDMRELGTVSKPLHEEVAKKILETLDIAILIGPLSQQYILPVLKRNDFQAHSFINFTSAKSTILELIKPKDVILVKGSQNTLFLERAVELLLNDKKDVVKLCRRGEYWDKIREKTL
ncbi:MAG TPA: Mur ligase family protein [Candidatus Sulfotelmatobacter sp.]|nr:Mur ligase family protein [Candidatus Sulfotelmatobacter sp.]